MVRRTHHERHCSGPFALRLSKFGRATPRAKRIGKCISCTRPLLFSPDLFDESLFFQSLQVSVSDVALCVHAAGLGIRFGKLRDDGLHSFHRRIRHGLKLIIEVIVAFLYGLKILHSGKLRQGFHRIFFLRFQNLDRLQIGA